MPWTEITITHFQQTVLKTNQNPVAHYSDVIMGTMASQITSITIVCSTVYSSADQRKYQSSASLAFVRGTNRGPVISSLKWPITRQMFTFYDVIMTKRFTNRILPQNCFPLVSINWKAGNKTCLYSGSLFKWVNRFYLLTMTDFITSRLVCVYSHGFGTF